MSEILTPVKAIRAYCLGCMCGQANEVKLCPITKCELYPYRFGTNPNYKPKAFTEEQRAKLRENARYAQAKKREKRAGDIDTPPTPSDDAEAKEFSIKNSKNEVSDNAERA